ncbi:hypothetical protein BLA29_002774 [Euroglyphus maynei]|uniref:Uncharacterized protein n=1 Tax=Euroglyphus maynei TaxID=6958 RepID=A0A1Y3AW99_EURMA|nr:hypothetical protein BLA29_002774 [Euroglyphus maynei]
MPRRLRRRKSSLLIHGSSSPSNRIALLSSAEACDEASVIGKGKLLHPNWRKESESWRSTLLQISLIMATIVLCCYTYFWFEHFHYHLTRFYAHHVDDHHAQHVLGHKLIRNRSHAEAFQWFRKSADHGHPHSAYNLAVGHLSGYRTDVKQGNKQ